jgi:hypothetical protein
MDATPEDAPPETPVSPTPAPSSVAPEVLALEDAFSRGDHAQARALAGALAQREEPALREAGMEGMHKLRLDPVVLGVFLSTGFLLLAVALEYLGHR